jgi:hypothetical protein
MPTKKFSVSAHSAGVELGVPVHVEPACAEGVRHRGDEGAAFTPTGLAAQADAVDVVVAVGHRGRSFSDELPGGRFRHFQAGLFHQVGAIHDHRAFAVERRRIKRAVMAQAAGHCGQDVIDIVILGKIVERDEPAIGAPDRGFVHADGHDVELATLGGDVGCHALTQDVFLQRDPFDLVTGLCGEIVGVDPACGSCRRCSRLRW